MQAQKTKAERDKLHRQLKKDLIVGGGFDLSKKGHMKQALLKQLEREMVEEAKSEAT